VYSYKRIEAYRDALNEGPSPMQRAVDRVACNKDTLWCLRSLCSCAVSLSSGLADLIGGGGLQRILSFKAKGRFLSRLGSGET